MTPDTHENASTEKAILHMGKNFDPAGGIALVCILENKTLLSRTDMRGKDVLEVGCGCLPACFGIADSQMPKCYVASDPSAEIIETACRIDARPEYQIESAVQPSGQEQTFDLLIVRGVLHHLADPAKTLLALRSRLRPGGQLLIGEPNLSCIPGNFAKWFLWKVFKIRMEESPYGQLPRASILQAIHDSGYQVCEEWYSSLLAFPLTGDYGRRLILPNNRFLFRAIIAIDRCLSRLLHRFTPLARRLHWRVIFLVHPT
jgi:SAM-dependent methyltransferase